MKNIHIVNILNLSAAITLPEKVVVQPSKIVDPTNLVTAYSQMRKLAIGLTVASAISLFVPSSYKKIVFSILAVEGTYAAIKPSEFLDSRGPFWIRQGGLASFALGLLMYSDGQPSISGLIFFGLGSVAVFSPDIIQYMFNSSIKTKI